MLDLLPHLARLEAARVIREAWRNFERDMNAKPARQPVQYHGCSRPVNTQARAEARRKVK